MQLKQFTQKRTLFSPVAAKRNAYPATWASSRALGHTVGRGPWLPDGGSFMEGLIKRFAWLQVQGESRCSWCGKGAFVRDETDVRLRK